MMNSFVKCCVVILCIGMSSDAKDLFSDSLRKASGIENVEVDDDQSENAVPILGKMVDFGESSRENTPNEKKKTNQQEMMKESLNKADETNFLLIDKGLSNLTRDSGDTVKLKCEAHGRPVPGIRWYKNEAPLEPERGKVEVRRYTVGPGRIGSRVRIQHVDIHDTGYYKCEAYNEMHSVETTAILMVKAGRMNSPSIIPNFPAPFPHFPALGGRLPEFEPGSDLGFCQQYRGIACSQLIGNKTVYVKGSTTLNQMEEKLSSIFTIFVKGKEMRPECHKYAVPFFCYVMFPPCDDAIPYPVPRHVCRDDCDTLEATTCKEEMLLARKHPLLANQDLVPDCEELPTANDHAISGTFVVGKENQGSCINLSVPRVIQVDHEATCYEGRGEEYRGPVSHTVASHQCQSWSLGAEYVELSGGHNYCRNPGGMEAQPWCFVADPHVRRELCDIPRCEAHSWLYIFLPCLAASIGITILLILWCKRQRRKTCPSKLSPHGSSASTHLIPIHQQPIEMQKILPGGIQEVNPLSIHFLHELGDGVFGKVFRGEMHHSRTTTGTAVVHPVAIKTLKESASTSLKAEFYREVERVSSLQHPNVVCLVGVCMREEPLCALFEYMFRCDLHEFLLVHSPHSDVDRPRTLELPDFLSIATQIAAGMEYLSNKRFVHSDLAARNCLVSAESLSQPEAILVKISDLGLSRHSCASEYVRIRGTLLPVRWMAPESLLYGTFTTESDVWAYGVTLWEIFSYGTRPFFNRDNQEVIDLVCAHQFLPRPETCPNFVYGVMADCWHDSPPHRPSFKEIFNRLQHHERTFSISHSVLSSHPSSTGPSNKTLSTNLSYGTATFPFGGFMSTAKMIPTHRTHQCEQV